MILPKTLERPCPPDELTQMEEMLRDTPNLRGFKPAPEVEAWLRRAFIDDDSLLLNEEHWHLRTASIGVLWTNVPQKRNGRTVGATAEIPQPQGSKWVAERQKYQLQRWFGAVPDFVITLSAPIAECLSDAQFCAMCEHELYHCSFKRDLFGAPKFGKSGNPQFMILGHDVEEFVGVVRRYGAGNAAGATRQLVDAALQTPSIADAQIGCICGTCGGAL